MTPEGEVLTKVKAWLEYRGFRMFRRNVAGRIRKNGAWLKVGEAGQADLYGRQRGTGRMIEVEIKAPGEKPTAAQLRWLKEAEADGCVAFWCHSVSMCEDALQARGLSGELQCTRRSQGALHAVDPHRRGTLPVVRYG